MAAEDRKAFLKEVCTLAVSTGGKVFGIGLSFAAFDAAASRGLGQPMDGNYWLAAAMYTCCLVQKKMQGSKAGKGLTVFIMDDNQQQMPKLSSGLYRRDPWFDGLYLQRSRRRGKLVWAERSTSDRFDQIVNTAFAVKSDQSSLGPGGRCHLLCLPTQSGTHGPGGGVVR